MNPTPRPIALVTGASGGMGRTIARAVGATMDLVLTDVAAEPLNSLSETLQNEGFTVVATEAGDLGDAALLARLVTASSHGAGLAALIHTAGLSPAQADWKTILRVNSLVTYGLVDAIEPVLQPGAVGVLVASMAGYVPLPLPGADALVAAARLPDDLNALEAMLLPAGPDAEGAQAAASGMAYVLSKRAVIRLCERRASAWGARGARLVSVSPGLIYTPMGRKEAAASSATSATLDAQPVSRWGTATDIASAVQFLISPAASFITGCDLRVDGGATTLNATGDSATATAP